LLRRFAPRNDGASTAFAYETDTCFLDRALAALTATATAGRFPHRSIAGHQKRLQSA
jgi:hypothetical protein